MIANYKLMKELYHKTRYNPFFFMHLKLQQGLDHFLTELSDIERSSFS